MKSCDPGPVNFDQTPFLVVWETTQACDLACVHCRAMAQPRPLPGELSHEEGVALIDAVAQMGTPVLVLSGGDPLKRPDLLELIRHGKRRGLRMATIPAATPLLTRDTVKALKDAGLDQLAMSLDASDPVSHDRFRGVEGAFQRTMEAIAWAHEVDLRVQINTVINLYTVDAMDEMIRLICDCEVVFWEVFFLVPVGRGAHLSGLSAQQYEQVFATLYELGRTARFIIKVTEAPHYRRYYMQRRLQAAGRSAGPDGRPEFPAELRRALGPLGSIGRAPNAANAGKGFAFISWQGSVYPSGFLPLSAGNVRDTPFHQIYRDAPLFRALRDPDRLKGRCGACEYRSMCGGSRSRAYAMTGDYLAPDPCCAYQPRAAGLMGAET